MVVDAAYHSAHCPRSMMVPRELDALRPKEAEGGLGASRLLGVGDELYLARLGRRETKQEQGAGEDPDCRRSWTLPGPSKEPRYPPVVSDPGQAQSLPDPSWTRRAPVLTRSIGGAICSVNSFFSGVSGGRPPYHTFRLVRIAAVGSRG